MPVYRPTPGDDRVRCISPMQTDFLVLGSGIAGLSFLDISDRSDNGMLVCVTETSSKADIDRFVAVLGEIGAAQ